MTLNNSNELNQFIFPKKEVSPAQAGQYLEKALDSAERVVARLDAELKDAKVKLDAHESLWKTSQTVITKQAEEILSLEKQLKLYKEEFSDASKNHLDSEVVIQNTKHALESVMEQFFKHENK